MKVALLAITVLTLFAAVFTHLSCTRSESPVRIGALLTLTGPAAYVGEEVRDGLLLAADEINQQGGINGRKIEIMVRDAVSQGRPSSGGAGSTSGSTNRASSDDDDDDDDDAAQRAFEELTEADPLLIVSCLSQLSLKLAPLAENRRMLLVALVATVPELTQNREWVYRYWTTAEHEAPPISDLFLEIDSQQKIDTADQADIGAGSKAKEEIDGVRQSDIDTPGSLGVIYMDDAYGSSVFKDMVKRCKEKGIAVLPSPFPFDNSDFSGNVNAVKDTRAVAVIGFDSHIIKILKTLRSTGYKGEIISTTTATLPSVTSIPESDGVHITAPAIYNKNYPFADQAKRGYEKRYGKAFTQYSANGYDFISIITGLLEDEPMNRESLKAILEKGFVYSGIFGNIELKRGAKDILFPLFPAQIKNGEIIYR